MFESAEIRVITNGVIIEYHKIAEFGRGDKVEMYFENIDLLNEYVKENLKKEEDK